MDLLYLTFMELISLISLCTHSALLHQFRPVDIHTCAQLVEMYYLAAAFGSGRQ